MSRPVPSTRALRALRVQWSNDAYICASCLSNSTKSSSSYPQRPASPLRSLRRSASTVVPVTSVHASKKVPDDRRALHKALSALEAHALNYVNLGRLSLALRGLESKDPVTRVAIRQVGGVSCSKRLARLLLADVADQDQEWEMLLTQDEENERYAANFDYDASRPLVRTLSIPSAILKKHQLEILLLNPRTSFTAREDEVNPDQELVASVEAPISSTGRQSQIYQPVHKAVVIGGDLQGMRNVPQLRLDTQGSDSLVELVRPVIDVTLDNPPQTLSSEGISVISLRQAERALEEIRQDRTTSTAVSQNWAESKVPEVRKFVFDGSLPSTSVKPVQRFFISSLLLSASAALAADEARATARSELTEERIAVLSNLNRSVTSWAEDGHTELRDELSNAFASRAWRKLAWYKLLWRVDDIGMIGSDILSRFYLVDAEKGIIWVGGRLEQAGLSAFSDPFYHANDASAQTLPPGGPELGLANANTASSTASLVATRDTPMIYFKAEAPWPRQITISRTKLLTVALPALQARAQSILLQAVSGSSISAAVGALAYAMVSSTGLYEAGAVVILGITVSAMRLQNLWDKAKHRFVQGVQEEGRVVLEEVEKGCRSLVKSGSDPQTDEGGQDRAKARAAIEAAQSALEKLK